MKQEPIVLSEKERKMIDEVAEMVGMSGDELLTKLCREGLARRVKKKTGHRPSASVLKLRR